MTDGVLPEGQHEGASDGAGRAPFAGTDSAAVAELSSRLVRTRPKDFIDPWPPATPSSRSSRTPGARGKQTAAASARRSTPTAGRGRIRGGRLTPTTSSVAQLVGPLVHPVHRHKRVRPPAHRRSRPASARRAKQKELRATVGGMNQAGACAARKRPASRRSRATPSCVSAGPRAVRQPAPRGHRQVTQAPDLRRLGGRPRVRAEARAAHGEADALGPQDERVHHAARATSAGRIIGFSEVDRPCRATWRRSSISTVRPTCCTRGLGNLLLWESVRAAFERRGGRVHSTSWWSATTRRCSRALRGCRASSGKPRPRDLRAEGCRGSRAAASRVAMLRILRTRSDCCARVACDSSNVERL